MTTLRKEIAGSRFEIIKDRATPRMVSDLVFRRCEFVACSYGMTAKSPEERRVVRSVELVDCKATNNTTLGPVIAEDVDVTRLATSGLVFIDAAAFRHVRVRGACGRFLIRGVARFDASENEPWRIANETFYRSVDWALDISEGEFQELDINGIPADLIRRDAETQFVVRRSRAVESESAWRAMNFAGTPWGIALTNMLRRQHDQVLVAPKRSETFARQLEVLRLLRREGIAEPD